MKKFQLLTQIVGMLTLILLALYGALALVDGAGLVNAEEGDVAADSAGIPNSLNYQGFLRDAEGNPLNGTFKITAKIYKTLTGGTHLYTTTIENVAVVDGMFNIILGDNPALPANALNDVPRYIGISLDGDPELIPRQRLHAVPWAMTAKTLVSDPSLSGNVSVTDDVNVGGELSVAGNLSLGGTSTIFGDWKRISCPSDQTPATVEFDKKLCSGPAVESDGFLMVVATSGGNNTLYELKGKVGSFYLYQGHASVNSVANQDHPILSNSFTMPVKKGDTWEVVFNSKQPHSNASNYYVYWLPLGQ